MIYRKSPGWHSNASICLEHCLDKRLSELSLILINRFCMVPSFLFRRTTSCPLKFTNGLQLSTCWYAKSCGLFEKSFDVQSECASQVQSEKKNNPIPIWIPFWFLQFHQNFRCEFRFEFSHISTIPRHIIPSIPQISSDSGQSRLWIVDNKVAGSVIH